MRQAHVNTLRRPSRAPVRSAQEPPAPPRQPALADGAHLDGPASARASCARLQPQTDGLSQLSGAENTSQQDSAFPGEPPRPLPAPHSVSASLTAERPHLCRAQAEVWRAFVESPEPDQVDLTALGEDMGMRPTTPKAVDQEAAAAGQHDQMRVPRSDQPINAFLTLLLVKVVAEDKLVAAVQRCVRRLRPERTRPGAPAAHGSPSSTFLLLWPAATGCVVRACDHACRRYVAASLGRQFTESPSTSLADIYKDSSPVTPIIFILSQGADPTSALVRCVCARACPGLSCSPPWAVPGSLRCRRLHRLQVRRDHGTASGLTTAHHQSGPGPGAHRREHPGHCRQVGRLGVPPGAPSPQLWMLSTHSSALHQRVAHTLPPALPAQNCHLAKSWMPGLERCVEDLQARYAKQQQFAAVSNDLASAVS